MVILCELLALCLLYVIIGWFLMKDSARFEARMKEWNRVREETTLRVYEDVDAPREAALLAREKAFRDAAAAARHAALYRAPQVEGKLVPLFPTDSQGWACDTEQAAACDYRSDAASFGG